MHVANCTAVLATFRGGDRRKTQNIAMAISKLLGVLEPSETKNNTIFFY